MPTHHNRYSHRTSPTMSHDTPTHSPLVLPSVCLSTYLAYAYTWTRDNNLGKRAHNWLGSQLTRLSSRLTAQVVHGKKKEDIPSLFFHRGQACVYTQRMPPFQTENIYSFFLSQRLTTFSHRPPKLRVLLCAAVMSAFASHRAKKKEYIPSLFFHRGQACVYTQRMPQSQTENIYSFFFISKD